MITRVEIIDWTKDKKLGGGRVFTYRDGAINAEYEFQDDEHTLKIFIKDKKEQE